MSAELVTESLLAAAPRAAHVWRSWLASGAEVPPDPDEVMAAFARYVVVDSEWADAHPRILGSALTAAARALQPMVWS